MSTRTFSRSLIPLAVAVLALGSCDGSHPAASPQPTPPTPPTALIATALSDQEIELTWSDVSDDETEFRIEFRTDTSAWGMAGTAPQNATRFRHRGLAENTAYSYRLQACNGSGCSPYVQIRALTQPPPCTAAPAIGVGQTVAGELTTSDCRLPSGARADRWTFTPEANAWIRIEMESQDFDAFLVLVDANGKTITSNDDGGSAPGAARIDVHLGWGVPFSIWASGFSPASTGVYRLSIRTSPCAVRRVLSLGEPVSDSILPTDCRLADGAYADLWRVSVPDWSTLRINLRSHRFPPALTLSDSLQRYEVMGRTVAPGVITVTRSVPPGTYYIRAASSRIDMKGGYELTATAEPPSCAMQPVSVGETRTDMLYYTDCWFLDGTIADRWSLTLPAATIVRVDLDSRYFATRLFVTDSTGSVIANGSYGPEHESGLRREFAAGTYTLWATGIRPVLRADYQISVLPDPCTAAPSPLPVGQTVSSTLSASDCRLPSDGLVDRWQFTLSGPATIRLDMWSTAFDTFLYLLDASGRVIAFDDDGGSGVNSRIVRSLAAGTYIVEASSYASHMTGRYSLALQLN
jgi:Fibronectin type III domain/Bacterial pre-peptidase C-terminal domain